MKSGRGVYEGRVTEIIVDDKGVARAPGGAAIDLKKVRFLPPCQPTKIVCIGRNYLEHAKELGNAMPETPLLFLKPVSSLLGHGGIIRIPEQSRQVEYEGEIGVVIKRTCRCIGLSEDPMSYVAGVTPVNDVTARDLQKRDVQFTRAKSFDTFCPVGPWIVPVEELSSLDVRTFLNGRKVQEGSASMMAFPIPEIVRFISSVMTLEPGDLIATGTPAGVGRLSPGDAVAVETGGVRLENVVG
jgi:2-keto-4-pentenoate hydratase/2-oxohepta-3-ene-1,7-dioic acid hydratase in catechol pathway